MSGWFGVDLDGTLAHYDGWKGELHIGAPIPAMVERVKAWLAEGREVRVFTARVTEGIRNLDGTPHDNSAVRAVIEAWCLEHIGQVLPVTNVKDYGMICLFDDRAVQVEANTGRLVDAAEIARLEQSEDRLIDQRDAAEKAASDMFEAITGRGPEWSNLFGYEQAVAEVEDTVALLVDGAKATTARAPALMSAENPTGWRLEELLLQLIEEIDAKTAKIVNAGEVAKAVMSNNNQIVTWLENALACQRDTLERLDAVGPDQGPLGKPRIGEAA